VRNRSSWLCIFCGSSTDSSGNAIRNRSPISEQIAWPGCLNGSSVSISQRLPWLGRQTTANTYVLQKADKLFRTAERQRSLTNQSKRTAAFTRRGHRAKKLTAYEIPRPGEQS